MQDQDILDIANHETVHRTPGIDAEKIAERIGVGYQVLNNKVNWSNEHNKLTQRESIAIQLVTNTRSIIKAECRMLGGEFVENDGSQASSISAAVLAASAEHGDVARAITDALGDGMLTVREEANIAKQIDEAIDALNALRRTARSRCSGVS